MNFRLLLSPPSGIYIGRNDLPRQLLLSPLCQLKPCIASERTRLGTCRHHAAREQEEHRRDAVQRMERNVIESGYHSKKGLLLVLQACFLCILEVWPRPPERIECSPRAEM